MNKDRKKVELSVEELENVSGGCLICLGAIGIGLLCGGFSLGLTLS